METLVGIGLGLIVSIGLLAWGWRHYMKPYKAKKLEDAVKSDKDTYKWGV